MTGLEVADGKPVVDVPDRESWRSWLELNHERPSGVWLVLYRAGSGKRSVTYEMAVEEALCFGWIDSKGNKVDDEKSVLWFSPRKPRSPWSRINKERVERLMRDGAMTDAGLKVIETAHRNGSWSAYDAVEDLQIPDDLATALAADEMASQHFEAFPPSSKKIILWWIESAKRPVTRSARIAETVRLASQNLRANHYRSR